MHRSKYVKQPKIIKASIIGMTGSKLHIIINFGTIIIVYVGK